MPYRIENTTAESFLPTIASDSIHLVVTDPPYFIDGMGSGWNSQVLEKRKSRAGTVGGLPVGMKFSPSQGHALEAFMRPVAESIFRVLKPGGFFICFSQGRLYHRMAVALEDAGFEIRDMLCWQRSGQPKAQRQVHHVQRALRAGKISSDDAERQIKKLGDRKTPQLAPNLEPMVLAMKPVEGTFVENWCRHETGLIDTTPSLDGKFPGTIMSVPRPGKVEKGTGNSHMTVKPVRLISHLIDIFSAPGQTVLDPFMGSGSHGVAALQRGRLFQGCEPDPDYFRICDTRIGAARNDNDTPA